MNDRASRPDQDASRIAKTFQDIRRAFSEFLTVPSLIVAAFILLAVTISVVEHVYGGGGSWVGQFRGFLRQYLFGNAQATSGLLGAIAGSMITVTSITFSLLLLAAQQTAASLTSQVLDQFLRRRLNQIVFGFFVGLTLYALITLATVNPPFNPVIGATLFLILTLVALSFLIILLYTTINQMRPSVVIRAIHDLTLTGRERQLHFVRRTRRASVCNAAVNRPLHVQSDGFIASVDLDAIATAAEKAQAEVEVILRVSIGDYVAFGDPIAEIKAQTDTDAAAVGQDVQHAVHLERMRDIGFDPVGGIEQLVTIGWTTISTSKQNPSPGMLAIFALRDLLARWSAPEEDATADPVPVVYPDNLLPRLMDGFESLAIVTSESMQHQNFAAIVQTFAFTFARLPTAQQRRAEEAILRMISCLGDHVPATELDAALAGLTEALCRCQRYETATAVERARRGLAVSVGELNSRSTRVPPAK